MLSLEAKAMEQNKTGRRVAQTAPAPHPAKRGLIALLAVAAVLCAAYLALCVYGGSRAAALPRTTALVKWVVYSAWITCCSPTAVRHTDGCARRQSSFSPALAQWK